MNNIDDAREAFMARAALQLFSSSSPSRYIRIARTLAFRSPYWAQLYSSGTTVKELSEVAEKYWRSLLETGVRDASEVDLALIIPLLARAGGEDERALLVCMARLDEPGVAWVAALARNALEYCAGDTIADAGAMPSVKVKYDQAAMGFVEHTMAIPQRRTRIVGSSASGNSMVRN